jgi:glycosyltransferase 2 family protein
MLVFSSYQKRALALSLVIAATLYLVVIFFTGYENILAAMARLSWLDWLLILTCSFVNYVLRFVRWLMYLKRFSYQVPPLLNFHYYMSGFALTTTPAKAGETIRSLYLKTHGVPFHHSLAMFLTERFLDVIVITLLAALSVLSFAEYGQFILTVAIALLLFLPLLRSGVVVHNLQRQTVTIRGHRLRRLVLSLSSLLDAARNLLEWRMLYGGILIGLAAWSIQGFAFYFILTLMDTGIAWHIAISIYAISLLAGALSFIPGGIGTTEAVMGVLLLSSGTDSVIAVAVPLISRLATLWFAVCLGLLSSLYLSARHAASPQTNSPQQDKPVR